MSLIDDVKSYWAKLKAAAIEVKDSVLDLKDACVDFLKAVINK